jgi:hypothetical protein
MRTTRALAIAVALLATACTSASPTTTSISLSDAARNAYALTDAEIVWCHSNPYPVSTAARVLELEGFEEIITGSADMVREKNDAFGRNLLLAEYLDNEWAPEHELGYNRACKAA